MPKTTITRSEYHQLLGLAALATRHNQSLNEICDAAELIVGIETGERRTHTSHVTDEIHGHIPISIDNMLRRLKIGIDGA